MNRDTMVAAPDMPAWLVWSVGAFAVVVSVGLSFRGAWLDNPQFIVETSGARWLLSLSVGALLGLAGASMPVFFRDRAAPPIIFGTSSGAAVGFALGYVLLGVPGSVAGGLAGAVLFYGVMSQVHRGRNRIMHPLTCLTMYLMLAAALYASNLTHSAYGLARDLTWWLLGDVGHAQWGGAMLVGLLATGMLLAAWLNFPRRRLGWIALVIALISAGPIAFISWFAFCTVQSRTGGEWRSAQILAAFTGATTLLTVDSVQLALLGPFAYGLNVPIVLMAVPLYLFWGRRSLIKVHAVLGNNR